MEIKNYSGLLFDRSSYKVVKRIGEKGDVIQKHNHPEAYVIFSVLSGKLELSIDGNKLIMCAGDVTDFDGDNHIEGLFLEKGEAIVTLVNK